jgi:hypothetical protein
MQNIVPPFKRNKALGKRDVAELRTSSGFSLWDDYSAAELDGYSMLTRFFLTMTGFRPTRPDDGFQGIKDLVLAFFEESKKGDFNGITALIQQFEYEVLLTHFSNKVNFNVTYELPPARKMFYDLFLRLAKDGSVFDVEALCSYIRFLPYEFNLCIGYVESDLRLKGDAVILDGTTYKINTDDYDYYSSKEYIHPVGYFYHGLFVKPLLKAYLYLFAALGLLEITQAPPAKNKFTKGKPLAISPYDALVSVRVTELGRWCLGVSDVKPAPPQRKYEAIADNELFLVTVRGINLERTIFLDKIGTKLGDERWRISPASFLSGCKNAADLDDNIKRFHRLIDDKPAAHWEALFEKLQKRAGLFDKNDDSAIVYELPDDRELCEELLRDSAIRNIAYRAEGGRLIIAQKNKNKFAGFLAEHGILSCKTTQ